MNAETGISPAEFSLAMGRLGIGGARPKIAVAVSGGGDSLALALLLQDWLTANGGELLALTVDHKLRPDSTAEALEAGKILRARGIAHEILTWQNNKPATHIQERAREARYKLLLDACRARGCGFLAVAHNLEDQVETFWMRLAHGSGLDGLAAMAPLREEEGVAIIRPLLAFSRARLRATCLRRDVAWLEDPSNSNEKYLRVRLRAFEDLLATEGLTPERLAQTLQKLEEARAALQAVTRETAARCVQLHPAGYAALKTAEWKKAPAEIQRRVLALALQAVAPQAYAAGSDAVEAARLDMQDAAFAGRTLGGCNIFPHRGEILLARETAAVEGRKPASGNGCWDGRFALSGFPAGESPEVGALGETGLAALRKNAPENPALEGLPFKVKKTLPALWQGENLLAVPHVSYYAATCPESLKGGRVTFCGKIV